MGKVAPGRAMIGEPPAGFGYLMLNWSGKVRLGKVLVEYQFSRTAIMFIYFPRDH